MLLKIIYIIFITSTFNCLSRGIHISEYNETNVILSMNSQLSEMRAKQEHHEKLVDGIAKAMNTQDRQEKFLDDLLKATNVQSIRTELEKQGKFIDGLVKESERQKKDGVEKEAGIKSIREGLDRQGNLINGLVKESERQKKDGVEKQTGIKSIREDLDRQGNLINGLVKESDFQLVRTDISSLRSEQERLGKDIVEKETGIKSIREDLDRQGNLINGLVKESDFQLVRTDISSLRAEQERLGKDGVEKEAGIKSIREGLDRQENLINGLVKESDIQLVRADISSLRSEQERLGKDIVEKETGIKSIREGLDRQENLINGLVKESDIQLVRADISSLRSEQERLGKDGVEKEAGIKSIREGLDRHGKFIDVLVKESERQKKDGEEKEAGMKSIKAQLDQQKNEELVKEKDIQSLKAEQELLRRIIDGLVKKSYLRNCNEAKSSGIHDIVIPNFSSEPFTVACDAETRGGGWTILLRRMDGTVTFNRTWSEYKKGFGELEGEFFLGLDKIHALTAERNQELLVLLEDQDGIEAFENYDTFAIGDEEEQYVLHKLGNASGTARDAIKYNRGMKFSTFDRDNDIDEGNCAKDYTGGWWYCKCLSSKLTGTYNDNNPLKGILWANFRGIRHSLKKAVMMIRPKK